MTTNSTLKYRMALEWCDANRAKLPRNSKVRLMTTFHLYQLINEFGAEWDTDKRAWVSGRDKGAPITMVREQGDWRGKNIDGKAIVRIIAHKNAIDKRVAEFTELCEALNWHILKVGGKHRQLDGDWLRQMITIQVNEGGD